MAGDLQAYWDWLNTNAAGVAAIGVVGAAIATAIYAFFTILLWFATRRQAILTRQMFEASHSPYVSIRVQEPTQPSRQGEFAINVVFENQGSVLAHIIKWEMVVMLLDTNLCIPLTPSITAHHDPFSDSTLIPGRQRVIQPIFSDERLPDTISFLQFQVMLAYKGSGPSIYITDFEAMHTKEGWIDQKCRLRQPEDILVAAQAMRHW
jgi:hypothetical protein